MALAPGQHRIDVWEGTILDTNGDGSLGVQQPIELSVVSRPTLEQRGAAPSAPCWQGTIVAVFRLARAEVEGVPRLCMGFQRFDRYLVGRGSPALLGRVGRSGIHRVLRWNGAWYTVGVGGLRSLVRNPTPPEACCQRPERGVIDAGVDGNLLFALDREGVWKRRAGFEAVERVAAVEGSRLAVLHRSFAVLQPDVVQAIAGSEQGRAKPIGMARLPGATTSARPAAPVIATGSA